MKAFTPEITYTKKDGTKYVVGKPTSRRSFPTQRLTKGVRVESLLHPRHQW